jgi:hypothetical protein
MDLEIHEIGPGCPMPPVGIPVRVWRADGSREAAVWMNGYWWSGGPIKPVRWQEMALRRMQMKAGETGRP